MTRYEFINNPDNLQQLRTLDFDTLPGMRHHYFLKLKMDGAKLDIHLILIDKETNFVQYQKNMTEVYGLIPDIGIEEMVLRKLNQMVAMKLIRATNREKERKMSYAEIKHS